MAGKGLITDYCSNSDSRLRQSTTLQLHWEKCLQTVSGAVYKEKRAHAANKMSRVAMRRGDSHAALRQVVTRVRATRRDAYADTYPRNARLKYRTPRSLSARRTEGERLDEEEEEEEEVEEVDEDEEDNPRASITITMRPCRSSPEQHTKTMAVNIGCETLVIVQGSEA